MCVKFESNETICERQVLSYAVNTPLGIVHLACFKQKPDHRAVIFKVLSNYANLNITAANITESKFNTRPQIAALNFDANWTHSGGYCILAYGEIASKNNLQIGVDLEQYSSKRLHLAGRFFHSLENLHIKSKLCISDSEREFFRLWCRKEAFYKCVGGDFFAGALSKNMLNNIIETVNYRKVYFVDLCGTDFFAPKQSALCIAVVNPN